MQRGSFSQFWALKLQKTQGTLGVKQRHDTVQYSKIRTLPILENFFNGEADHQIISKTMTINHRLKLPEKLSKSIWTSVLASSSLPVNATYCSL